MKNFTKKYFPYLSVISFLSSIFISFIAFATVIDSLTEEELEKNPYFFAYILIGFVILVVCLLIYSYFFAKSAKYEINDKHVLVTKGIFFKKKSLIELEKIHAVNFKQGLIQRMFKISTLMVDSGSTNTSHQAEAMIVEDENVVKELIEIIKGNQKQIINKDETSFIEKKERINVNSLYEFTSKRKTFYSLLVTFIVGFILVLTFGCMAILLYVFSQGIEDGLTGDDILVLLILIIPILLLVFFGSLIGTFLHFHGFKVYKENNDLIIEYGLLVKNHNTFKLNRIKAVKIEQGLIFRLFGFAAVKLEVIGYTENTGNNQQTNGILIPLCKKDEINSILEKILPDFVPSIQEGKGKSLASYFTWSNLILLVAFVIDSLIVVPYILLYQPINILFTYLITLLVIFVGFNVILLISSLLDRGNQDIVINGDKLTLYYGSFVRKVTVVNRKNIVAIEDVTTTSRAKKGIYTYIIHIRTNNITNRIGINLIDEKKREELLNMLLF